MMIYKTTISLLILLVAVAAHPVSQYDPSAPVYQTHISGPFGAVPISGEGPNRLVYISQSQLQKFLSSSSNVPFMIYGGIPASLAPAAASPSAAAPTSSIEPVMLNLGSSTNVTTAGSSSSTSAQTISTSVASPAAAAPTPSNGQVVLSLGSSANAAPIGVFSSTFAQTIPTSVATPLAGAPTSPGELAAFSPPTNAAPPAAIPHSGYPLAATGGNVAAPALSATSAPAPVFLRPSSAPSVGTPTAATPNAAPAPSSLPAPEKTISAPVSVSVKTPSSATSVGTPTAVTPNATPAPSSLPAPEKTISAPVTVSVKTPSSAPSAGTPTVVTPNAAPTPSSLPAPEKTMSAPVSMLVKTPQAPLAATSDVAPAPTTGTQYAYSYDTGYGSATETREGEKVSGQYTVPEADGSLRVVKYTVDGTSGFVATVSTQPAPNSAPPPNLSASTKGTSAADVFASMAPAPTTWNQQTRPQGDAYILTNPSLPANKNALPTVAANQVTSQIPPANQASNDRKYEYNYSIASQGDTKSAYEVRDGDKVRGQYRVNDPDGTVRIVKYTVDGQSGFQAVVETKPQQ